MYQIKFRSMGYFNRECGFCGNLFETGDVTGYLTDKTDRQIFLICEDCFKAGIEKFPSILKGHAGYLKNHAAFLEKLSNQTIKFSREEYERLKKEVEEEWKQNAESISDYKKVEPIAEGMLDLREIRDLEPF
jgi:hypothetical protein